MPNKVEQVPITVAGNILSELSEKIPNNIIALNELIKNAYDAFSPSVDIILDSSSKNLTIRDYGIGMDTEGIKKLFHISSSDKQYGTIISYNGTIRLTQGSKGLGFLSVFKFGKKVYCLLYITILIILLFILKYPMFVLIMPYVIVMFHILYWFKSKK